MCLSTETVLAAPAPCAIRRSKLSRALTFATVGWLIASGLIMTSFAIRSARDQSLATLAIYFGGEGESPDPFYDREFDFPTGYYYVDIPIWLLDLFLIGSSGALLVALWLATPRTGEPLVRGSV